MSNTIIENVKTQLWEKKPHVTKEYLLACIVEELQEMNKTLVEINSKVVIQSLKGIQQIIGLFLLNIEWRKSYLVNLLHDS